MTKVLWAVRLVLAGIFLYAGLIKASGSAQFALALAPFTIVPPAWITPLAQLLPLAEILAAVLILIPATKRLGATLILLLCLTFLAALTWALANGIIVDCACFGPESTPSAGKMTIAVVRDVVLAMLAGAVIFWPESLNNHR